ncbi:MFS transporter [Leifsonia sp. RAF41]|uniref:MFS transporter n=1 Tax=Leifsonia sp. RAF41 TaxID=3233056 RepID=UPI003F9D8967
MTELSAPQRRAVNPWWVGWVAGMASFVDGAALVGTGLALVIYQQTIGLKPEEIGLLTSVLTFGVAVGAIIGGRLGDRFGRRRVFITTMLLIAVGATMATFGTQFPVIFAGIALMGIAIGADIPVSLSTIAEAATDENRGKILVLSNLLAGVGIGAAVLVATFTGGMGRAGAQAIFGMIAIVAVLVLVLRLSIPESASWTQARNERRSGIHTIRAERTRFRDLVKPPLRFPFLVLAAFFTLVSIPITLVSSYAAYIAANFAGVPVSQFSVFILLLVPLAIIVQYLFMRVVDTRFRLTFFLIGGVMFVAAYLIPVVFGVSLITLVAMILTSGFGTVFCGEPIFRVWVNEAFPTLLRSTGQGVIFSGARLVPALLLAPIPVLLTTSLPGFLIVMSVLAAVGVGIGWWGVRSGRMINEFDHETEPVDETAVSA